MPRGNKNNLELNSERTPERRKEIARAAGIASGKARARKKTMMEEMKAALDVLIKDKKGEEMTTQYAICLSQIKKALSGDTRAAEFARDTSGQKPIENINANLQQDIVIDLSDLQKNT